MTTNVQPRSNPLSSLLESTGVAPVGSPSTPPRSADFASVLKPHLESGSIPSLEGSAPGGAPVSCWLSKSALSPLFAKATCQNETDAVHAEETRRSPKDGAGDSATPEDWGPEGYPFKNIPDEDITPSAAVLFWRRPQVPPSLAREAKLALAAELRKAGFDPSLFAVSYWESKSEWPGGFMVNHHLTILLPNGNRIDVCAEWTRESPDITLMDIRRALGNRGADYLES
jgi:hypothetical protein